MSLVSLSGLMSEEGERMGNNEQMLSMLGELREKKSRGD
ncbi:hypothetical protein KKC1_26550 [Calderihabitans maritimus]|uniref:Uncharacterized protein n=1 Tax=Calderihabitans maritimus TaxID=1246530 RepID=A0A1Z5HVI5_9FIRM|nr:hypothetical protein KKC1_26550 [Calderihabitans maritimus]